MKILATFAVALLCSGCALTTAQIDVPYQTAGGAVAVPLAASTTVDVAGSDGRTTYRDRVSTKKNGYGMEMAAIVASNDLPSTVSDAFKQELTARGLKIGGGGANVHVELVHFYNDFKNGFFSGDAIATVAFNVKVTAAAGNIAFSKYYEGSGTQPNIQIAGGDNARAALIKAFTAAVSSAVNDPDFTKAIITAGGQVPAPAS